MLNEFISNPYISNPYISRDYKKDTILGIVGSRKRNSNKDYEIIKKYVIKINPIIIISGEAEGVDSLAKSCALKLKIKYIGIPINKPTYKISREEFIQLAYDRNWIIARVVDVLLALPKDNKGGTMNTVGYFKERKDFKPKNLIIINER